MKMRNYLLASLAAVVMYSCSQEGSATDTDQLPTSETTKLSADVSNICNGNPVNLTTSGNTISVNSSSAPEVDLIAIHSAADFSVVQTLCDPWGITQACGSPITSQVLNTGNYLLKVASTAASPSTFCWIPFTITDTPDPCNPVTVSFPGGGLMVVDCIAADVTRLDVHNTDFTVATDGNGNVVGNVCNPWNFPRTCVAPFTHSGLPVGNRLLRVEFATSEVQWIPILVN